MDAQTITLTQQKTEKLLELLGIAASVEVEVGQDETIKVSIKDQDDVSLGVLIGYRGQTLHSLQKILGLMVNQGRETPIRVELDIGGYQAARVERLKELVLKTIEKVRSSNQPVELMPMSASDRRVVHLEVGRHADLESASVDEGWARRVVIRPKTQVIV